MNYNNGNMTMQFFFVRANDETKKEMSIILSSIIHAYVKNL